jgi:hypothetical protein
MTKTPRFLPNLSKQLNIRQALASLGVLIPVVVIESLNRGRLSLWILPLLLIGVLIGIRRGWPVWSGWWVGWSLVSIGNAWVFGVAVRLPVIFILWKLVVLIVLCLAACYAWRRRNGFETAFMLLPLALEFPRLVLFADLPAADANGFFLTRAISVLIYALAAGLCFGPSLRRRWWVLFTAVAVQFVACLAISFPTVGGFFLFPSYLTTLAFLAFGVPLCGTILDGWHWSLSGFWKQAGRLVALIVVLVCAFLPWLTGDGRYLPAQAPGAAQTASGQAVIIDTDMSHDDVDRKSVV